MRFVCLSMILVVACDGGGGGGEVPIEELPSELSEAVCAVFEECEVPGPIVFAGEGCATFFEGFYTNGLIPPYRTAIDRGTIRYDAALARACIDAYTTLGCELVRAGLSVEYSETCSAMFAGQVPDGGECDMTEECGEGSYCAGSTCPGTCTPRVAAGDPCEGPVECALGHYCVSGTCRALARGPSGGPCEPSETFACPIDEVCIGATSETPGTCTAQSSLRTRGAGESCSNTASEAMLCEEGLSCAFDGSGTTCHAASAGGGACFVSASPGMCPDAFTCTSTDGVEGTCTAVPGLGDPCETTCTFGLRCAGGECAPPLVNGEPCAASSDCASQLCTAGTCAAPDLCTVP